MEWHMQKKVTAQEHFEAGDKWSVEEVTFIALPSARDIEAAFERLEYYEKRRAGPVLDRYREAMWRIRRAQEQCAVVATQVLRPDDYRDAQREYRLKCDKARQERNTALLKVFSEKCTKGF
jgi:hypothetical protein